MNTIAITSTVTHHPQSPLYEEIKRAILGSRYELSLVFVGRTRAKTLNSTYRHKNYVPNVLSFPLTKSAGEIVICPAVARSEAKKFNLTFQGYVLFLFIHGCLHLKGYDHGDRMEKLERTYCKKFNIT